MLSSSNDFLIKKTHLRVALHYLLNVFITVFKLN